MDRDLKRRFYQRAGVHEYWIVDLEGRHVERWTPGADRPEVLADDLRWAPAGVRAPLDVDLRVYFSEVLDS